MYDTLNSSEIKIAESEITEKEKLSVEDGLNLYKDQKGLDHRLFHAIIRRYAPYIFRKYSIGEKAKLFSNKTTGYFSLYRFYSLFRLITSIKPKIVFEFGSGASSVFIAECLELNKKRYGIDGRLYSFEQNEDWYNQFIKLFPKSLMSYTDLNLRKVKYEYFNNNYRGLYYDYPSYPEKVDLIYVDGPTKTRGNKESDDAMQVWFCADIVKMKESGTKINFVTTDKRYSNHLFYKEYFHDYKIRFSKYWHTIIIDQIIR